MLADDFKGFVKITHGKDVIDVQDTVELRLDCRDEGHVSQRVPVLKLVILQLVSLDWSGDLHDRTKDIIQPPCYIHFYIKHAGAMAQFGSAAPCVLHVALHAASIERHEGARRPAAKCEQKVNEWLMMPRFLVWRALGQHPGAIFRGSARLMRGECPASDDAWRRFPAGGSSPGGPSQQAGENRPIVSVFE
jgi:hypothetical protein